ncbi:MAG: hypothetical protein A3F41_03535 [Coxiella sp. RIFCSPHIGHO2_12_FULL_44_14]|nr:MAG: hypothetical protein A3F41_03535 [Coxiella sp. RIFCSPHIGHO2_12_FULL_44_14]
MRTMLTTLAISAIFLASGAVAATHSKAPVPSTPKAIPSAAATPQQPLPMINLYAEPKSGANIIGKLSPPERVIPIFRQEGWVKVGDPKDGKVGWINRDEYHQAIAAWYKPNVQSYFVQTEQTGNGKPTVKVVAYSNGKKLDDKEAQALYAQMQQQSWHQWQAMQRFNRHMERLFAREQAMMDDEFGDLLMPPIIVIHQPAVKAQANTKADSNSR